MKKISKKRLEKYWKLLDKVEEAFGKKINKIERQMSKELEIKDLGFFWCDGEIVGVGNKLRTMKLIHRY